MSALSVVQQCSIVAYWPSTSSLNPFRLWVDICDAELDMVVTQRRWDSLFGTVSPLRDLARWLLSCGR
jgi:hypothetical protein